MISGRLEGPARTTSAGTKLEPRVHLEDTGGLASNDGAFSKNATFGKMPTSIFS
jgi:hypothetical protein